MKYEFTFDTQKNLKLKEERGVSFEEIISLINGGSIVDTLEHHNKDKYPNQRIYVINVSGYAYLVPFVRDGNKIFLKTILPSRKVTKKYKTLL